MFFKELQDEEKNKLIKKKQIIEEDDKEILWGSVNVTELIKLQD